MIVKEDDAEALPGGHLNEGFGVVSAVAEGGAQIHQGRRLFVGHSRRDKKEVRRGTKGKRKDGRDVNALEKVLFAGSIHRPFSDIHTTLFSFNNFPYNW